MAPTSPRDTIEPMRILTNVDPARLKKWLIAIAVIYVLFPRDLIPDYLQAATVLGIALAS